MLSKTGEIRRDEICVDFAGANVLCYPCHGSRGNQFWQFEPDVIFCNFSGFVFIASKY